MELRYHIHVPTSRMGVGGGGGGEWNANSLLRKYWGSCHQKLPLTFDWPELCHMVKNLAAKESGKCTLYRGS